MTEIQNTSLLNHSPCAFYIDHPNRLLVLDLMSGINAAVAVVVDYCSSSVGAPITRQGALEKLRWAVSFVS